MADFLALPPRGGVDRNPVQGFGIQHQPVGHAEVPLNEDIVPGLGLLAQVGLKRCGLLVEAFGLGVKLGPLGLQGLGQVAEFGRAEGSPGVLGLFGGELVGE